MALEATLVIPKSVPISFPVAIAHAIPKGSFVKITDPFTVAITAGDTDPIIGITAEEKVANVGTQIAVYTDGIFKGYAGLAGVVVGMAVITDTATGAANELVVADVNSEHIVGMALETAADGETFLFQLNPFAAQLA
jgi:hypothetical protein